MNRDRKFIGAAVVFISLCLCLGNRAYAEEYGQAKVMEIKGEAMVLKSGTADWMKLEEGMILKEGDAIKTGKDAEIKLETAGAKKTAELYIRKDTQFSFKTLRHDAATEMDDTLLDVGIGSVLVKAEKLVGDSKFEVKTPTSIVGIRGTTFEVNVQEA